MQRTRPLIFDVTLSYRSLGAQPDGILRSERAFARAVLDRSDLAVTFCRYDRHAGGLIRVSHSEAAFIVGHVRTGPSKRPRSLARALSDITLLVRSREERRYRMLRWDLSRHFRRWFGYRCLSPAKTDVDSVLILAGMIFDTHDINLVERFKAQAKISIFAICYDMLPLVHPEYFQSSEVVDRFRTQTELLVSCADRIASISQSARDDLTDFARKLGRGDPDLTSLVLGFEIPQRTSKGRPAVVGPLAERGYVLCVGNINIRKNHALLYRVWRGLSERRGDDLPVLVIAGRIGWRADDVIDDIRTDPVVRGRIVMIHDADDDALAWLYENCLFTVYPSLYEGWGLPVSESLAFGRHCLTSNSSSMPQAAAGLATTLDPRDDVAWTQAVEQLLDRPQELQRCQSRIASEFRLRSWTHAGAELIEQALTTGRAPDGSDNAPTAHIGASRPAANLEIGL